MRAAIIIVGGEEEEEEEGENREARANDECYKAHISLNVMIIRQLGSRAGCAIKNRLNDPLHQF